MPRADLSFRVFWEAYPCRRDRLQAEQVWKRMSGRDRRAALAGIAAYRDECLRTGVALMYPKNYLTHRRWEDEYDGPAATKKEQSPIQPADTDALSDMETW